MFASNLINPPATVRVKISQNVDILPKVYLIIIIIIKICSAHISTLLGAQGAETEKT